jgi:ferrous iron transport protein A
MSPIPLHRLKNGQPARIHTITGDDRLAGKLDEMGMMEGMEICILHRGPIGGDPLAIRLSDRIIALRKRDAGHISVEPV